jgi:hypothetical protein
LGGIKRETKMKVKRRKDMNERIGKKVGEMIDFFTTKSGVYESGKTIRRLRSI